MIETETRQMFGRTKIYTDVERITAENVVAVLEKALRTHAQNNSDIQYLWDYYRGKTPILNKTKEEKRIFFDKTERQERRFATKCGSAFFCLCPNSLSCF